MNRTRINFRLIQVVLWFIVYTMLVLYFTQKNRWEIGFVTANIFVVFFLAAVYGNANYLIIRFFHKNKYWEYGLYSVVFLLLTVFLRMLIEDQLLNRIFIRHTFYGWNYTHFSFLLITQFLAFLFGFLLRISIDYVDLLHTQEILRNKQLTSELNLLKAQVQPHFLFNTLNNIYSLSVSHSPKTSEMIAKLSDMMRYFVDEATKEKVLLESEIQFLENYIELEQIRMVNPLKMTITNTIADQHFLIPPMLLIPFVENIFKHGVNKTLKDNEAEISLSIAAGVLHYTVRNKTFTQKAGTWRSLANLQKRLALLYPDCFGFEVYCKDGYFDASLSFPVV
ncbi:sensor histidine kinase [Emticicia sp. BO119]|uniref:sensor histidine kinase n=1 Tax=Emticicia sp. BO119 TaxID=2757768 RepID=UPI0015F0782B|nr:sensor histidine kinase [Emticicia sp. BO119]MBA4851144.1 sensor histidine kinase [Emticicia sp. BO119]